ncbi:MAG: AraC family transcriptional regulator [Bacteroidota bacterium]|nr:AraC family transcriptional regulator [Bacteroidota bacterium]
MTAQFNTPLGTQITLLNADKCTLDTSWHYCDLTSPFSRIYLITEGEGYIFPDNQKTLLEPGYLYLIPSFVTCSYTCSNFLEQYYLHFTIDLSEGLNIYDLFPAINRVKATENDMRLFERLLELNPETGLRVSDPALYQKKAWLNRGVKYQSIAHYFETSGIIYQLISRFFSPGQSNNKPLIEPHNRFRHILTFIRQNIDREISIKELALKACLSGDHFTRAFKKATGQSPLDYINLKRIEKAQLLLVTTDLSLKEILEKSGFNSASYFNRIFKTVTGTTPLAYRKNQSGIF